MKVKIKVLVQLAGFRLCRCRQLLFVINHLVSFRFNLDITFEVSSTIDRLCLRRALLIKLAYNSTSEDLERWGNELLTSRASWTLPTIRADFHSTVLTWTHYISLASILLINPLHSSDKKRTAFRSICIWHLGESFTEDLIAVYNKFLVSAWGSLLYSLRRATYSSSTKAH